MKHLALAIAVIVALSGAAPRPHHLVYQFGYNTKVASSGNGTGTTTIDIAPAAGKGLTVSGADFWWNTVRPRAVNPCNVSDNGDVDCAQAPYAISPIQVTIYSFFGRNFFAGLNAAGTSAWTQTFTIHAAAIPGATGFAGTPYTWKCVLNLQGKGVPAGSKRTVELQGTGTLTQQGGHYRNGTLKVGILYDTKLRVPVFISMVRSRLPQMSVYNQDLVQLQLLKYSSGSP